MRQLVLICLLLGIFADTALGGRYKWSSGTSCVGLHEPFSAASKIATITNGQLAYNWKNELCTCTRRKLVDCYRIRRDFTSMPQAERQRFVQVYKKVSTEEPYKATYDRLVNTHSSNFASGIHKAKQFLPWHRMFVLQLENLLRKVDQRITMPYWDWSLFSGEPWKSGENDVFSDRPWGLGGNGSSAEHYCVTNGPFGADHWKTTPSNKHACLKRDFNGNPPDIVAIHELIRIPGNKFDKFETTLRDAFHDNMHCRVGGWEGTMCSRGAANAPEFFLHHGFTDKLWSDWQKKGDKAGDRVGRDEFFTKNTDKMVEMTWYPRDLVDLSRQPGGVKVMYADPAHHEYRKIHSFLSELTLAELKEIPRERFTEVDALEFKVFMVSPAEQAVVDALQDAMEPLNILSHYALRSGEDRTLGVRVKDIEAVVYRKRALELKKRQQHDWQEMETRKREELQEKEIKVMEKLENEREKVEESGKELKRQELERREQEE